MTRSAEVYFLSDKKAVELVEATNDQVGAVVDLENGNLAFQIQMRAFQFKIALMEEHFNENYVEAELYPKATFRGTFLELPKKMSAEQELLVKGTMDFHGIQKEMNFSVTLSLIDDVLVGNAEFVLLCSDFGIEIPKLVADKLANAIQVKVNARLKKI